MNVRDENYATGMYDDRASAEAAVERLHALGYSGHDISVMMDDKTRARDFAHDHGTHVTEGATAGALLGGSLGGLIAAVTATGSVAAVVGTGGLAAPFVAGPLAAALAGLGAGGIAGGLVGGLIGVGIPEHRAKQYEERLSKGGILVGVKPRPEHRDEMRSIFPDEDEPARSI